MVTNNSTKILGIGKSQLRAWLATFPQNSQPKHLWHAYGLGMQIAAHFLGSEWVEKNIMTVSRKKGYVRQENFETIPPEKLDRHFYRVIELGEGLFNLQHADGFNNYLESLAARDVEAAMAEIETAKLLWIHHIPFKFIKPVGQLGKDYDFEIQTADGQWVCADTKCKIETTEPSSNSVFNSLKAVIAQVPEDRPSFAFLRVPQSWCVPEAPHQLIDDAVDRLFKMTRRIVSVKVQVFATIFGEADANQILMVKEIDNPNAKFTCPRGWAIFKGSADINRWKSLLSIASGGTINPYIQL